VYKHLSDNGIFVFDIFKPRIYDDKWLGKEDISYDIVDGNKRIIRSTINYHADTVKKYIQYKKNTDIGRRHLKCKRGFAYIKIL
jgi:hypothetical protein